MQREAMEFDAVIVGGGPAGLASAGRLKQLAAENGTAAERQRDEPTACPEALQQIWPHQERHQAGGA